MFSNAVAKKAKNATTPNKTKGARYTPIINKIPINIISITYSQNRQYLRQLPKPILAQLLLILQFAAQTFP